MTTGKQQEYLKGIAELRKAGKSPKAFAWPVRESSNVAVVESGGQYSIVRVETQNVFTLESQAIMYRFDKMDGQWLISDWASPDGQWWPQS